MEKGKRKFVSLFTLVLITLMFSISSAEDPGTVNLEGSFRGLGLQGDQKVEVTFSLYNSDTADTAFWTQQQNIEIRNGKYNAELRSFPGYAFRDDHYYLGVELRTEKGSICLGRKRLAAVIDL